MRTEVFKIMCFRTQTNKNLFTDPIKMIKVFQKMESVMSTIEILVDKESMKAIRQSKEDLLKGRYIEGKPENLDKILAREDEL